jgi:hypothetical protein
MLALSSMQSTVAAAIGAASFFTAAPAVACIVDDGLQDSAIETQLRTLGCVVVVPPILRAGRRDLGAGRLVLEAEIAVRVMVNPHVNTTPTGANRNIYSAIAAATQAVLAWSPATVGDRRFETTEDFLSLTTQDTGLLAYHLIFTKLSTLN